MPKGYKTIDFIVEDEAKKAIDVVNRRVMDFLGAHIVDVVWREEARAGAVILRPYAYIDKSGRGGPRPYQLGPDTGGIWAWVYVNQQPVWLEGVRRLDLQQPARNRASDAAIEPQYLDIHKETDSIVAVPLVFRDSTRGVYSIELPISGRFTVELIEFISQICAPIAAIIWKAEVQRMNQRDTAEAISLFTETILHQEFPLNPYRTGFIARPFDPEFNDVEDCLKKFIDEREIKVEHYAHIPGTGIVVQEMTARTTGSHFAIVDVTELNPNVLVELGMIMVLGKKFLLLRRKGDESQLPFDVRPYHCYEYKLDRGPELLIWNAAANQFDPLDRTLQAFIQELFNDQGFREARPFLG